MLTLDEERQSLLNAVVNYGFHIFWGAPHSYQGPTLHWNRQRKPEIESFLALAKAQGAVTLFVDWDVLADKDLAWLRSLSGEEYDQDDLIDIEIVSRHIGEIGRLTVGYFKDNVCHIYEHTTEWFDELLKFEETTRRQGLE